MNPLAERFSPPVEAIFAEIIADVDEIAPDPKLSMVGDVTGVGVGVAVGQADVVSV